MKPSDQLMLSIGALLATERQKRGIAVEKAAKETRMRPQRIRDMENDDLSHFTNPSYARMFLIAYAKYLDIPMPTIREYLPDRGESGTEDYHYITAAAHDLPSLRRDLVSRPIRRGWLPKVAVISLSLVLIAVVAVAAYIFVNLPRLVPPSAETAGSDKPSPTPTVVTQTILVEEPHLDNLTPPGASDLNSKARSLGITAQRLVPTTAPSTFTDTAVIATPPTPAPIVITEDKPTELESAPAASPSTEADRAFLLSTSPNPPSTGLEPPPIVR
jgi:cytoskeletal protein RodZ